MFFFFFGSDAQRLPEDVSAFLKKDALTWNEVEQLLSGFRSHHAELTLGTFQTFLYIARRAGLDGLEAATPITITTASEALNMPYPTIARHCDILSSGLRGREGLNWISKTPGPDGKTRQLRLTNLGLLALTNAMKAEK